MKNVLYLFFTLCFIQQLSAQSTWQYLPTAPSGTWRIDDVFFLNKKLGWSAGSNGEITKTTDGGVSWDSINDANSYLRCIEFYDENIGYAGTLENKFLRTTDGGHTWTNLAPSITPMPRAVCGISIVDSLVAYAVGEYDTPGFYLKTTNGGTTWTSHDMSLHAIALVDVFFLSRDTGFVAGQSVLGKAIILYTTDGGLSWANKFESTTNGQYCWKIQQVTPDFWVSSIQTFNGGRFAKSYDGGQTWTEHTAPVPDMQGIGFATPLHGWVGGYVDGFYETLDGGSTWKYLNFGGNFNRFYFLDSTLAYASGLSIYKFSDPDLSSVDQPYVQKKLEDTFKVNLFPNPAKGQLDIQFHLEEKDNLRMCFYAMDGTLLQEVYHERQVLPGDYQFRADCSKLPAGAYFLGVQRNCGLYSKTFIKG